MTDQIPAIDLDAIRALTTEIRDTMQRQEWVPASLAIRATDALDALLALVPEPPNDDEREALGRRR